MRRTCFSILLAGLGLAAALSSAAQTTAQIAEQTPAPEKNRAEPVAQEIHIQDKSVTIDELRVGGQTQSIEVKPSNDKLRPYQVQPEKADAGISDKSSAKGMTNRSWKLFNF